MAGAGRAHVHARQLALPHNADQACPDAPLAVITAHSTSVLVLHTCSCCPCMPEEEGLGWHYMATAGGGSRAAPWAARAAGGRPRAPTASGGAVMSFGALGRRAGEVFWSAPRPEPSRANKPLRRPPRPQLAALRTCHRQAQHQQAGPAGSPHLGVRWLHVAPAALYMSSGSRMNANSGLHAPSARLASCMRHRCCARFGAAGDVLADAMRMPH